MFARGIHRLGEAQRGGKAHLRGMPMTIYASECPHLEHDGLEWRHLLVCSPAHCAAFYFSHQAIFILPLLLLRLRFSFSDFPSPSPSPSPSRSPPPSRHLPSLLAAEDFGTLVGAFCKRSEGYGVRMQPQDGISC